MADSKSNKNMAGWGKKVEDMNEEGKERWSWGGFSQHNKPQFPKKRNVAFDLLLSTTCIIAVQLYTL